MNDHLCMDLQISIICFGWGFISYWWGIFCLIMIIVLSTWQKAKSFLYILFDNSIGFFMELLKCEMEEKYYLVVDQTSVNNALTYSIWREGTMQTIFYPSSTLEILRQGYFFVTFEYLKKEGTLVQILFFWSKFSQRKSYCQLVELLNSFLKRMLFK